MNNLVTNAMTQDFYAVVLPKSRSTRTTPFTRR